MSAGNRLRFGEFPDFPEPGIGYLHSSMIVAQSRAIIMCRVPSHLLFPSPARGQICDAAVQKLEWEPLQDGDSGLIAAA